MNNFMFIQLNDYNVEININGITMVESNLFIITIYIIFDIKYCDSRCNVIRYIRLFYFIYIKI